jgi:hypothetical protein
MGGNTGNFRTQRNQSGTVGYRTLGSILASDGINGAGSLRRTYGWYKANSNIQNFYQQVLGLNYGQIRDRSQYFLKSQY